MTTTDSAGGTTVTAIPWAPTGVEVRAHQPGSDLRQVPVTDLKRWVADHRVLVLRNFAPLPGDELPQFCERLGTLVVFDFGVVDNIRALDDARSFLFTRDDVPFHFDGLFLGEVPSYQFFSCEEAPPGDTGGETLFCDTIRVLERADAATRKLWEQVTVRYTTEKLTYYGGEFAYPLLGRHPLTGATTVRYAEPVVNDLNPATTEVHGIPEDERAGFMADLRRRIYDPEVCLAHSWEPGDFVITDNHALLHGRRAYTEAGRRHLRRVNIL
jgi:alpha-ketoglutarate-dependent taurine dioxygenase